MPQHADESADDDFLLAFSREPGGKPPESAESLADRIDCLERALHRSTSQIELLKGEVATLVGTIDEIGKRVRRPGPYPVQPVRAGHRRYLAAIGSIVFGFAVAVSGWTLWSGDRMGTMAMLGMAAPSPAPLIEEPVVESTPATQPEALLAAEPPAPVTAPVTTSAEELSIPSPVEFVGTLSIDAAPGGQVFVDREAAGQTPLRVQNLKAGSHLVWIEREGYRRFTRVVEVPANRVSRVWADLERIPEP